MDTICQDEREAADSVEFTHYPLLFTSPDAIRREKGSVRHLDIFKENAFHHEGHEGHEEVAIRFIAHRGTEKGDTKLKAES
jgi:hypothetical protein